MTEGSRELIPETRGSILEGTIWYQKGKTSLDFNEATDGGVLGCSGPYANNLHLVSDR